MKYTALLSQIDQAAPVADVLDGSIGDINWSYHAIGEYRGHLDGAFPERTIGFIGDSAFQVGGGNDRFTVVRVNDDEISVMSTADEPRDGMLIGCPLWIQTFHTVISDQ